MSAASAIDSSLLPGFADPVIESQQVFRAVLGAMARPGSIVEIPSPPSGPATVFPAAAAVLLCLADQDTPVWFDRFLAAPAVAPWLGFHCGCALVPHPDQATFALIADAMAMPPLSSFPLGSEEYPDRSATLIIQVPALTGGAAMTLSGPGIRDQAVLAPDGLPRNFVSWLQDNHALFPRGVDLVFASETRIAALPRSTRVKG